MLRNTNKYQYEQLETYKEMLELRHMKTKTLLVNILIVLFGFIVAGFLFRLNYDPLLTWGILFMFILLLGLNLALYSYSDDLYNNLKLSMYVNVIGVYVISVTLIVLFRTPSIFTSLFLAYAVTAIYQDYKVMLISNGSLAIVGMLFILYFDEVFAIPNNTTTHNFFILIFMLLFILLLTLSSYILIKRKTFFYNQLAQIKESEVRNMGLMMEIDHIKTNKVLDSKEYYSSLQIFSKELSKKIGIENVFSRKIKLLKDLKKLSTADIIEKYPEYTVAQVEQIAQMELTVNTKMRNIALKASKTKGITVSRKEIFSESQFKSFKHPKDHRYVKIISFVVFYCLMKIDKPYLKELDEELIKDTLLNSEYFYRVDRDIIDVYLANNEVFDTIVNDIVKDQWNYAQNIK